MKYTCRCANMHARARFEHSGEWHVYNRLQINNNTLMYIGIFIYICMYVCVHIINTIKFNKEQQKTRIKSNKRFESKLKKNNKRKCLCFHPFRVITLATFVTSVSHMYIHTYIICILSKICEKLVINLNFSIDIC